MGVGVGGGGGAWGVGERPLRHPLNPPLESDVLLFSEFINIVSILFYNFIEFMILLNTFLAISFPRYKDYIKCLISFSKFSDRLHAFTCSSATGNL